MSPKKQIPRVWDKKDRKGPVDIAKYVQLKKRISLNVNEIGIRPKAPLLGGVARGPIHVRPVALAQKPIQIGGPAREGGAGTAGGGAPGGAPVCPVNVTKLSGATILTNPNVVLMWWSTYFWDRHKTERDTYKAALNAVANDAVFWGRLSEYGITGGSYGGQIDLTRFGGPSATLTEQAIQDALSFRFDNLSSGADSNAIYVVMLPNGLTSDYDTSNGFIGHHQTYKYRGQNIWYSVVEYSTDTRQTLSVITHEVYEAATDPDVSSGYFDHAQGGETEVGDLCNGQTMIMDGYTVQQVWSQNSCNCK
jgi:hypothetical protein